MNLRALPAVALLLVTLAGCIGDPADEATSGDLELAFVDPMATNETHDHSDYVQHQLRWNMTEVGWTTVVDGAAVAWGEMDAHQDLLVVSHAWPTAGLATVDISDPANPQTRDHYDTGVGYGADVKLTPDGRYAVLAVQEHGPLANPTGAADPLAQNIGAGIHLYDVSDPADIRFVTAYPHAPFGIHMVSIGEVAGRTYVFAAQNTEGVGIYELVDTPQPHFEYRGIIDRVDTNENNRLNAPHDMTFLWDEAEQTHMLYVSDSFYGIVVFELSGFPLTWTPRGQWIDTTNQWYTHTAHGYGTADGFRRMVVVPEVYSDAELEVVSPLWVVDADDGAFGSFDATDTWNAPGDHGAQQLRYSVHNFQLLERPNDEPDILVLAHYHAGVWVLEVGGKPGTGDEAGFTRPIGYLLPANDPGRPMSGIYRGVYNMEDAPTVWDVIVHEGIIWATDVNSGLYAMRHGAISPGEMSVG